MDKSKYLFTDQVNKLWASLLMATSIAGLKRELDSWGIGPSVPTSHDE